MEQRTLNLNGTMVYCFADGNIEFLHTCGRGRYLRRTLGSVNHGYLQVKINNKHYSVHRLIAMAFHANPNSLPEVDHIDRNKQNNKPSNLRWVNIKQNQDNTAKVDKSIAAYGVRHCEDSKAYEKQRRKHCLNMLKPDESNTRTGALTDEAYNLLKHMTQKERYLKYSELKNL